MQADLSPHGEDSSGVKRWAVAAAVLAAGLSVFLLGLGGPGLMDPDEGRYAEIAREMLLFQDWLVPRLNSLPYLEKPPLVYWLTALSFSLFGFTEWAARLPAALTAWGGVVLAYVLGRRLGGERQGLCGALVLFTSGGYVVLGRLLTLDMVLAFFLNFGVGLGLLAYVEQRRSLLLGAYAALALGALSKGPVALVLAGLIWGGYAVVDRRFSPGFWLHSGGILLFLALTVPWFVLVSLKYPEFIKFFFWEHHVGRFATAPIHAKPVYFFLPLLLAFFLPWTFLLPWSFKRLKPWTDPMGRFLLVWAGVVLSFFSLSRGKLPPYILPALLPLALLLGRALAENGWDRVLKGSLWLWLAAGLILLIVYLNLPAGWETELGKIPGLAFLLAAPLLIFTLAPALALACRRLYPVVLGSVALSLVLPLGMELVSRYRSPREAGRAVAAGWQPGAALVGLEIYSQALTFYARQPMHLFNCRSELEFGLTLVPTSGFFLSDWEELAAFTAGRPKVFFLVRLREWPGLKQRLPGHWEEAGRYKDCVLAVYKGK